MKETREIPRVDSIVESVIDEHIQRAEKGLNKYGVTLDRTDLSFLDYLQHAKEESMDLALYLEKAKQEYQNVIYENECLKKLCKLANVPQIFIDNPLLPFGPITNEDIVSAKNFLGIK